MKRWISVLLILLLCQTATLSVSAAEPYSPLPVLKAARIPGLITIAVTVPDLPSSEDGYILVCALYDGAEKMLESASTPVLSSNVSDAYPVAFRADVDDSATIKVFLLDAVLWMPCCDAVEQTVPEVTATDDDTTEEIPFG